VEDNLIETLRGQEPERRHSDGDRRTGCFGAVAILAAFALVQRGTLSTSSIL
jgi:hypothetical protein